MFNIYMNQKVCAILLITREQRCSEYVNCTPYFDLQPRSHCRGVRPGGSRRPGANRSESCRNLSVHILPAMLRTRPGLGQKVITVCAGYATICDSSLPVQPRWRYGVSRCVPKSHSSAPYTVAKPGVTVSSPWTQLMSV